MVFEYKVVNAIMVGISLLYFACMMSVEESPVYYEMKNREKDAAISYAFYRNVQEDDTKNKLDVSSPKISKEKSFSISDLCKYWNFESKFIIFHQSFSNILSIQFQRKIESQS